MNDEHFEQLIGSHLHGTLTPEQCHELEQRLLHSAADRERFWQEAETHAMLHKTLQTSLASESAVPPTKLNWFRSRIAWRSVMSLAASTVFGIVCTSLVFGYVLPRAVETPSRPFGMSDGSFEEADRSVFPGFPSEFGVWGGHGAETVMSDRVKAAEGENMLAFSEASLLKNPLGSSLVRRDAYQIVDLSSLKPEMTSRDVTMELSVQFLDTREISGKRKPLKFSAALYVFSGSLETLRAEWPRSRSESLSTASAFIKSAGLGNPRWRPVTVKAQLPAEADYVLVHLFVTGERNTNGNRLPGDFGKQFADDVRLTIKTMPTSAVSRNAE